MKLETALSVVQFGGKHPSAKPGEGKGPGVFEVVEDHRRHLSSGVHGQI